MTIVMIGQKGLPARSGGIERHVQSLAEGLVSRGHRVVVFGRRWYVKDAVAPQGIIQDFSAGIHTKHLDALTHSVTALFKARAYHPDIVHLHGVGIGLLAPLARLIHPRAKIVVTFHCLDRVFSKWGFFARQVFRLGEIVTCYTAHRVITVSQYLLQYCQDTYGCRASYISHPFRATGSGSVSTPLPSGLEKQKYFLFVGRLLPHKGAHLLVKAFARAQETHPELFADKKLAIVGGGSWTDEYVLSLKQSAERAHNVVMLGEITGDALSSLQTQTFAHIFPTWEEGLSVAVLEAGVSGRPVVLTDLAPNKEALGGNAIQVRAKDVDDLTRGLVAVAQMDEPSRLALADRARQYVEKQYDYERAIDNVVRLYREAGAGERLPAAQPVTPKI